ncbi:MAG TPA: low molecular weight protein arginine phosphatase [Spirochaetia bacterium]|nr:low molecular weight protein arginine phosphatase [Spirochaetia bacterium]
MATILFICSGNTCRSPMAAAMAGRYLALAGSPVPVASAGVDACAGRAASALAVTVMEQMGLSLAGHRACRVTPGDLRQADLVLAMEGWQLGVLAALDPSAARRSFTLTAFTGEPGDVSDPFGGDLAVYRQCARELDRLVGKALTRYLDGPDFSLSGRE